MGGSLLIAENMTKRTEERLRQAERDGDPVALLRAKLHAGIISRQRIELAAYVGHEASRELVGCVGCDGGGHWDTWDFPCPFCRPTFPEWVAGISRLAESFPPVKEICATCGGYGAEQHAPPGEASALEPCFECKQTGLVDAPATWHVLLRMLKGAGHVVLPYTCSCGRADVDGRRLHAPQCPGRIARECFQAFLDYFVCQCERHFSACLSALSDSMRDGGPSGKYWFEAPLVLICGTTRTTAMGGLNHAVEIAGEKRVREGIRKELIFWVLGSHSANGSTMSRSARGQATPRGASEPLSSFLAPCL